MIEEKIVYEYLESIDVKQLGLEHCREKPIITGSYSGESNKIYFVRYGLVSFVLKINGVKDKDPEFFEREFYKLRSLEEFGIAPKAFIYDKSSLGSQSMILEMIEGETLKGKRSDSYLEQILFSLNKMAEIPTDVLKEREGFKRNINSCWEYVHLFPAHSQRQLAEYSNKIGEDQIYRLCRKASETVMKRIENEKDSFRDAQMGLIHTGLHPENMVYTPAGKIRFIDWEHSSIGDRAFEISSLLRSNNFSEESIERIFKEYRGQTGNFRSRVNLYTDLFKVHEVLWHALRLDKARKGELNLSQDKTESYYQEQLNKHLEILENSGLI